MVNKKYTKKKHNRTDLFKAVFYTMGTEALCYIVWIWKAKVFLKKQTKVRQEDGVDTLGVGVN